MGINTKGLQEAREAMGYTQKQAAQMINVAPSTYNQCSEY